MYHVFLRGYRDTFHCLPYAVCAGGEKFHVGRLNRIGVAIGFNLRNMHLSCCFGEKILTKATLQILMETNPLGLAQLEEILVPIFESRVETT